MSGTTRTHVDPLDLVAYVRGTLSRHAAAGVRAHCRACAPCGDQLAAIILLRRRAGIEVRPSRWRVAALGAVAAAAALALVAIGLTFAGGVDSTALDPAALAVAGDPTIPIGDAETGRLLDDVRFRNIVRNLGTALAGTIAVSAEPTADIAAAGALAVGDFEAAAAAGRAGNDRARYLGALGAYSQGRSAPAAARLGSLPFTNLGAEDSLDGALERAAALVLLAAHVENGDDAAARTLLAAWLPQLPTVSDEYAVHSIRALAESLTE